MAHSADARGEPELFLVRSVPRHPGQRVIHGVRLAQDDDAGLAPPGEFWQARSPATIRRLLDPRPPDSRIARPRRDEDALSDLPGQRLMARELGARVAELQVRAAMLNGYTAFGIPVTGPVG